MTARGTWKQPATPASAAAAVMLFAVACDPVVGIAGAFFPGWMAAALIGAGLTAAVRYLLVMTRLDPHIGPPAVIYASLGLLLITASWLVLYRS
jgi:hypothetical protein